MTISKTPFNLIFKWPTFLAIDPFDTPAVAAVAAVPGGRGRGRGRGRVMAVDQQYHLSGHPGAWPHTRRAAIAPPTGRSCLPLTNDASTALSAAPWAVADFPAHYKEPGA